MHCNGKCQVMKKIREEEKKEQENLEQKWEIKVTVLAPKTITYKAEFKEIPSVKPSTVIADFYKKEITASVFHPPQFC